MQTDPIDTLSINTIRLLAADMVEKARSGHPGMPMGAAPMAYVLWTRIMKHNPENPQWLNRDRFVLSAGHGSALLYSLLHLCGYDLDMEDLQQFRQWGSRTPGHPEYGHTPGVETTTGPLGQGFANAVGMAIAERYAAGRLNRQNFNLIDYHTWVICGDGDLMEGISSEAASIAGHLKLEKLVCLYDHNRISIEGSTGLAFTEDVAKRFDAFGWHVLEVDGNDTAAVEQALREARKGTGKPVLVMASTNIGYGSPAKQDSAASHGAPLGEDELATVKRNFGFPADEAFHIPEPVRAHMSAAIDKGRQAEEEWIELLASFREHHPDIADRLAALQEHRLGEGWEEMLPEFDPDEKLATRKASQQVLHALVGTLPFLVGGSADLAPSTGTALKHATDFNHENYSGTNFRFGVREHAMGAITNGMALSGLLRPYGATFLVFADYMKPPLRLSALMQIPSTFIFTHDSIAVGEDGPTHQPVEQLIMLRSIPGLTVIRPADACETASAWKTILENRKPVALVLSRQSLPVLDPARYPCRQGTPKGGYILAEWGNASGSGFKPVIIIATGAEVHIALDARQILEEEGIPTRVVSMPSIELFEEQPEEYRYDVLPPSIRKRVVVEAASPMCWHRYATDEGTIVGVSGFGASAPGERVLEEYGFTSQRVAKAAKSLL
ncbi:transketolase [Prosthecochloris sp. ZM_2]|uniref:transketolase n=1 Tax=Prosthecochloris sp. ZM_2 TaxID=2045206 RepID=UPI000DF823EF|nr:transketolase [Prosthecochloris sp. ZM_2]RNA65429.1 transketolase [Prosthecochloris sp. ZM_2]